MALSPGSRLGSYEVTAKIGQGGMGEVYRAHDIKLGRDVALKVLPDLFADDPERLDLLEELKIPWALPPVRVRFPPPAPSSQQVTRIDGSAAPPLVEEVHGPSPSVGRQSAGGLIGGGRIWEHLSEIGIRLMLVEFHRCHAPKRRRRDLVLVFHKPEELLGLLQALIHVTIVPDANRTVLGERHCKRVIPHQSRREHAEQAAEKILPLTM